MTSMDYGTTDEPNPMDPDPAAPGPGSSADTPGVPAGSAEPIGETDFVDGAEISTDADPDADDSDLED